jgi:hypothetical protein
VLLQKKGGAFKSMVDGSGDKSSLHYGRQEARQLFCFFLQHHSESVLFLPLTFFIFSRNDLFPSMNVVNLDPITFNISCEPLSSHGTTNRSQASFAL